MRTNSFCPLVESIECQNENTSWLFKHAFSFIIDVTKKSDYLNFNVIKMSIIHMKTKTIHAFLPGFAKLFGLTMETELIV